MAGISSKSAGNIENKKKYNGIEFDSDLDLNEYEAYFRDLDPQIGRWWQVDPKIEHMEAWSPYVSMFNNPIKLIDPLGDEPSFTDDGKKPKPKPTPPHKIVYVFIPQKLWPNVYNTMMLGVAKGLPLLLNYDNSRKNARARRRAALSGYPPARPGYQLDEYPYASTEQGGNGASVNEVPASENMSHGGYLGAIVQINRMQKGDQFFIIPIRDAPNLNTETSPATNNATANAVILATATAATQQSAYNLSPNDINKQSRVSPSFNMGKLSLAGAALQALFNTLFIENLSNNKSAPDL